ncbi:MAG: hypothetical protein ACREJM_08255, partial [Candidatus Saccharimonadales bacterium]
MNAERLKGLRYTDGDRETKVSLDHVLHVYRELEAFSLSRIRSVSPLTAALFDDPQLIHRTMPEGRILDDRGMQGQWSVWVRDMEILTSEMWAW